MLNNFKLLIGFLLISGITFAQTPQNDTINKTDKNGRKQGYWRKKDEKGKLKYEGYFINDKPQGEFKYYYPEGNIKAVSYFYNNGGRSFTKTYYPNGKLMSEGYYLNEKKDSIWKYYNGYDVIVREEFYKNYLKHGNWKTFSNDGMLIETTTWKNGIKDGPWELNYIDGKIKSQFKNNVLEGLYQDFSVDNKLKSQGKYIKGKMDGIWLWYNNDGTPIKRFLYKKDILLKRELVTYENGKPVNIPFDDIAYVYQKSGNTILVKRNSETKTLKEKYSEITEALGIDDFLIINKNFLANVKAIKGIENVQDKNVKVILMPKPDIDVIAEEESSKALKVNFKQ